MRKVYLPYVFLTGVVMAVAAVNWLLQLVLFIYHDDHKANVTLMVVETMFVLYVCRQHITLFMLKENTKKNPHLQIAQLLVVCSLFILQAWWLLIFVILLVLSYFIGKRLNHVVVRIYHRLDKSHA